MSFSELSANSQQSTDIPLSCLAANYNFVLGSGSATRKLILRNKGIDFVIRKADIDEKSIGDRNGNPRMLVTSLAIAKAEAIILQIQEQQDPAETTNLSNNELLLTADQVVTHNDKILEKPESLEQARTFIRSYINSSCSTVGSIALTHIPSGAQVCGVDSATIHFGQIPDSTIEAILSEGTALHCAGGLMVEHPLLQPYIERIEGTQESLMGLSCELLASLLRSMNATLQNHQPTATD